jgi:GntR family transcriptional regulator, transcriptional repressor for pyruvate dehydrogenase complex
VSESSPDATSVRISELAAARHPFVSELQAIRARSAADEVVEQVLGLLGRRVLRPGDRLPSETELARVLEVGRSTVREAKRALIARGFLEARGKLGTFVASPKDQSLDVDALIFMLSDRAIHDLHEARQIVEVGTARLAAVRMTPDDERALGELLTRMEQAAPDDEAFWPMTIQFHQRLAEASHNQALTSMFQVLSQLIQAQQMPAYRSASTRKGVIRIHRELLKVILAGDAEEAARVMAEHLEESDQRVRSRAKRPPASGRARRREAKP